MVRKGEKIEMITTVCGEIPKEALGNVLPHEHLLIDLKVFTKKPAGDPGVFYQKLSLDNLRFVRKDPYSILDNAVRDEEEVARHEVELFGRAGGNTIVDATLDSIGRDPLALKRISESTGVHIVMGCGFYVAAAHPKGLAERSEKELAAEMVRDIREGVRGTGVRAGVIGEIGTSAVVTPEEWKCVAAAGLAHLETGKAIHVHTSLYETNGIAIVEKLLAMGVAPSKIAIDHIDVDIREDYIERLLDFGVFVEFDNFGKEFYISKREGETLNGRFAYDFERAETVARLVGKGYAGQILLTNDICIKNMLCTYGGFGYAHILENIRPMLRDCGVREEDISRMISDNAAIFLDDKNR